MVLRFGLADARRPVLKFLRAFCEAGGVFLKNSQARRRQVLKIHHFLKNKMKRRKRGEREKIKRREGERGKRMAPANNPLDGLSEARSYEL